MRYPPVSSVFGLFLSSLFVFQLMAIADGESQFQVSGESLPAIRINEVMASNGSTIADEDGNFEDWIELYNYGDEAIDLSGWGLSDNYNNPFKWAFPEGVQIDEGTYLLVWASGKNRNDPTGPLHSNYAISAGGEEVILTMPEGTRVDELEPTAIPRDVSMGRVEGEGDAWFFFVEPTPGATNVGLSGVLLDDDIYFSEESGLFEDSFLLTLSNSIAEAKIRYTLDGSDPTEESPLYTEPFLIKETSTVNTRSFSTSGARSFQKTKRYIQSSREVLETSSNLPILLMDAYGASNEDLNTLTTAAGTPRVPATFMLWDRKENGLASLLNPMDVFSFQGIRFRGNTSRVWDKKPYSIELWDENGAENHIEILGMAPHSDWVLYAGYLFDRSGVRNAIAYDLSNQTGRWAAKTRFVEVYINHDGGTLRESDYVGVYTFMEMIREDESRLGYESVGRSSVPPTGDIDVFEEGPWTGNYLFKMDRSDPDEYAWKTDRGHPVERHMVLSRPKLRHLDGGPYRNRSDAENQSRQLAYIKAYIGAFEAALYEDLANEFSSREYTQFIDTESFIDHFILNVLAKNVDGLRLSAYFHKPPNQKIQAGPVWDFDRSMFSFDSSEGPYDEWNGTTPEIQYFESNWWGLLFQDVDFEQAFYDRIAELRQTSLQTENVVQIINKYREEVDPVDAETSSAAERNLARWPEFPPRGGTFSSEMDAIIEWFENRLAWMDNRHMDGTLLPDPPQPVIQASDSGSGPATVLDFGSSGSIVYAVNAGDPRGKSGSSIGEVADGIVEIKAGDTIIARHYVDGVWSTPFEYTLEREFTILHAWDFEGLADFLEPSFSVGGGELVVEPGASTEAISNTGGDFATQHLRVNNPLGSTLTLSLPSSGYEGIKLDFLTRRSGQGAELMIVEYTTDGNSWSTRDTVTIFNDPPQAHGFDFTQIEEVNDNPDFALRFSFSQGDGGTAGNNRFDDIIIQGVALPGVLRPPLVVEDGLPAFLSTMAGGESMVVDLSDGFEDPNEATLTFSASSSNEAVLVVELDGSLLSLNPLAAGEVTVSIGAANADNQPVMSTIRALVYPAAQVLADGDFQFTEWNADEPAGSYPQNMIFLQSNRNDPELDTALDFAYNIPLADAANADDADFPYAATGRSRINGLGEDGASFINTGRGRDLGGALVALNTQGLKAAELSFIAGTVLENSREYALRLQYRIGIEGDFTDLLAASGKPIEYRRSSDADVQHFESIDLPELLLGEPYVQLLWRYYHVSGDSGPRSMLRLDDVRIYEFIDDVIEGTRYSDWVAQVYPDSSDQNDPEVSGPLADPLDTGLTNLMRYALGIVDREDLDARKISVVRDGTTLTLTFPYDPEKLDLLYQVVASEDLVNWNEVLWNSSEDANAIDEETWVSVTVIQDIADAAGSRFARLELRFTNGHAVGSD
ncbi:MAG: CotH kinase family protein [Opitutales bacterium]|nr:CotH kinase family protein [Opitutales bacterium]